MEISTENKKATRSLLGYLINPKLQISIIIYVTLIMIILMLQFYIFISNFNQDIILLINSSGIPQASDISDTIIQMFQKDWQSFLYIFAVIYIFFLLVGGLVLSHRIAGPMEKLKKHLQKCTETKALSTIQFRDGDFFADVAESFNTAIESVKKTN